jgi:hypothetical protein
MVETKLHSSQGSKIVREAQPQNEQTKRELIILTGITTSQINQALKADDSYPSRVFLKVEGYEQDIPVFFRLIDFKEQKEKK